MAFYCRMLSSHICPTVARMLTLPFTIDGDALDGSTDGILTSVPEDLGRPFPCVSGMVKDCKVRYIIGEKDVVACVILFFLCICSLNIL